MYIRRQVDDNWYEGERNAMIGIFPVTYIEIVPNDSVGSLNRSNKSNAGTLQREQAEGKGKAKFNFQVICLLDLRVDCKQPCFDQLHPLNTYTLKSVNICP